MRCGRGPCISPACVSSSRILKENHERLPAEAAGKSKREIEEMAARLSPKPPVPNSRRKLPPPPAASLFEPLAGAERGSADRMAPPPPDASTPTRRQERRPII